MVCFADVGRVRTRPPGPGILGSPSPEQEAMIQTAERIQQWVASAWMTTRGLSTETANTDSTLEMAAESSEVNTDSTLDAAEAPPRSDRVDGNSTRWSAPRPPTPGLSFPFSPDHNPAFRLQGDALMQLV